jgi:hypothetical protein
VSDLSDWLPIGFTAVPRVIDARLTGPRPPSLAKLRRWAAERIVSDAEHISSQSQRRGGGWSGWLGFERIRIQAARDVVDRVDSAMRWADDGGPAYE